MNESLPKRDEGTGLLKKVPPVVCLGLLVAITLDTGVQVLWKLAVQLADQHVKLLANPSAVDTLLTTVKEPLFWVVAVMFSLQLVNWRKVLEHADLSYSQPITSLSYISVIALSAIFLHERISLLQLLGVTFILAGVWFISQTDHNTAKLEQQ